MEYTVAIGHDKFNFVHREMTHSFDRRYIPQQDVAWYHHQSMFRQLHMEENIIRAACHPRRISYFVVERGCRIDTICD